ncbi:MAG TPA: helix-turn-helix domain-containing protein [Jiangellaceae bacterium]
MRAREEVARAVTLAAAGFNASDIARATGIPRTTVRMWLNGQSPNFDQRTADCPACAGQFDRLPRGEYVYLLGLYLGDGTLSEGRRSVYKLRIICANAYPRLMRECEAAMAAVLPNKIGRVTKAGCTEVYSNSKHWPCLFPQHGPGMKHTREIKLADWQQRLVDKDPRPLIRGLIHSDGCRVLNRAVGTKYPPYPRYHFTNTSADIRQIFTDACDAIGVEWRRNNATNISVARRASVAILDSFIGPKQ